MESIARPVELHARVFTAKPVSLQAIDLGIRLTDFAECHCQACAIKRQGVIAALVIVGRSGQGTQQSCIKQQHVQLYVHASC